MNLALLYRAKGCLRLLLAASLAGPASLGGSSPSMSPALPDYALTYATPTDPALQRQLVAMDERLRARDGIAAELTSAGVLDLRTGRLALVRPDRIDYAASVPKIAILLAWFETHRDVASALTPDLRREFGLMIKLSDNAIAAKHSQQIGLQRIQQILEDHGLYDAQHGGGIWIGKHYGKGDERRVDPVGGHSHAATVRQLLRFYLLLEQGKLVSPAASRAMREIFVSSDIEHHNDRFVRGFAGRNLEVLRKAGWWQTWFHDTAIVTGPGRHYILVALTHHEKGNAYLESLATAVDDMLSALPAPASP